MLESVLTPTGHLKEGFELINEALNLFNNVYGPMHPEIASCMRNLARLNYLMGEHLEVGRGEGGTLSPHSTPGSLGRHC